MNKVPEGGSASIPGRSRIKVVFVVSEFVLLALGAGVGYTLTDVFGSCCWPNEKRMSREVAL